MKPIGAMAVALVALMLAPAAAGQLAEPARISAQSPPEQAPVSPEIPVALLVDLSTGQTLFEREADRRFMPASVTKVMTAYTAFKLVDEGKLRLDRRFLYTEALEDEWYAEGSNMFLKAGERPTIGQLLLGITTVSGNDASVALAIAATGSLEEWLTLMNANAAELGMADTHFGSPNGYPDGGQTYTSARDLAVLGQAITELYPGLYARYFGHRRLSWRNITQANHDPVTGRVEGADGMKTGYTNEAGFTFLGSAEREGRRLVMVLAGAPTSQMRDKSARDLLEWGFAEFEPRLLMPAGSAIGQAQVQDGAHDAVGLQVSRDVYASVPEGRDEALALQLAYRGPVAAPIAEGQSIATLRILIDGEVVREVPLEATGNVAKANAFQRVANALARWLA